MSAGSGSVAVILAAGLGTRMKSGRAKVLHCLGGLPLVTWSVRAVRPLVDRIVVVIGHDRDAVREALRHEDVAFAVQPEQHGTGHALACALPEVGSPGRLLVMVGDMPGLLAETLRDLVTHHEERRAAATVLTFRAQDPAGYGRIVRGADGSVTAIVEHSEASAAIRAIDEVNSGAHVFEGADLLPLLPGLPRHGSEIYLTDALELLRGSGRIVAGFEAPEEQCAGINTQAQLAAAQARWMTRRIAELMANGVSIVDPTALALEADVRVGPGTILAPFVALEGTTAIGARCEIGSFVRLRDVRVGDAAVVRGPFALEGGEIPSGARVGS